MIRFSCAHCSKKLKAPEDAAGKPGKCPRCGRATAVPSSVPPMPSVHVREVPVPVPKVFGVSETEITQSHPSEPIPVAIPATEEETQRADRLIPCSECNREIAKEAVTCPGCGAPNRWVHPEIARFLRSLHRFKHMPYFEIQYEKYVLVGVEKRSQQTAATISNLVSSFGVIAPLNVSGLATLAGVHFGGQFIQEWASKGVKAFRIDFRTSPPTWQTTNDQFWDDVLYFFGL